MARATSERRHVSILFVDLEDFTGIAQSLDPEEVRRIQSRYFEVARSVVAAYGGTLEKFIGDAVMAVWGAPVAHEDDAERAVRAALDILRGVARLGGAAANSALRARAAVTTGQAAVTVGATDQGIVAGDVVNAAARLQALAPSDAVLVDDATRQALGDHVEAESIGEVELKGRTGTIRAHRIREAARPPTGYVGPHTGPFVGRDDELREVLGLLDGVVEDARCRLLSITGIAGIGKSRLVWELAQVLDARPTDVAWHRGRAPAWGMDITFAAVADMVRQRVRVPDDASSALAVRQLSAVLRELVRDEEERGWLEARVGVLLGADAGTRYDRDELFAAWRRFFERVADRAPTVLVFEDLQWADPGLLDFIEHLAAWARDHPILVIGLARPELLDRRPAWGSGAGRYSAMHLERLDDEHIARILSERAPGLGAALTSEILRRAGGIPLYAVEVVRMLGAGTAETPSGTVPARDGVPRTLQGLIAARIDALPAGERRLLMAAAVLGRRFHPEALAAVAGGDPGSTRVAIDALVQRELLSVEESSTASRASRLAFVQDLVREVAVSTLARDERRAMHLAAARFLEGLDPDEGIVESLGVHLVEAHRLAPNHADAPRIARRAVAALVDAARESMRLHLPERALRDLEQALDLDGAPARRAPMLEQAAEAASAAGRLDRAEALLREAIASRDPGGRGAPLARTRARLAGVLLMQQRNATAIAELESALRSMRRATSDPAGVELIAQLARARMLAGQYAEAIGWAERALSAAEELGAPAVATDVRTTRGTARFLIGDDDGGRADLRTAIAESQAAGALHAELRARNNLAWMVMSDDPRLTFETARAGHELASEMGIGDVAIQMAEMAVAAALDAGAWPWALERADRLLGEPLPDALRVTLICTRATIRTLQGVAGARADLERLRPLPEDTDPQIVAAVDHAMAWTELVAGSHGEAHRLADLAARGSLGAERARAASLAARAALWAGDVDAARGAVDVLAAVRPSGSAIRTVERALREAIAMVEGGEKASDAHGDAVDAVRSAGLPLQLALCLADRVRLLGDGAASRELRQVLERLGATGLRHLLTAEPSTPISPGAAPRSPARSRPPSDGTARRTDGARRSRRGTGRPSPPG